MEVEYSAMLQLSKRLELAAKIAPDTVDRFLEEQIVKPMVQEMVDDAPVDSGALRDSLRYIKNGRNKYTVGSFGISYVKFVTEGTAPHEIRPKDKAALSFVSGGTRVFATKVNHPGTKANPFMTDAKKTVLDKALPRLAGVMMEDFKEK